MKQLINVGILLLCPAAAGQCTGVAREAVGHGDTFCTIGHVGKEVMLIIPRWRLVVAACGDRGGVGLTKPQLLAEAVVTGAFSR